MGYIYVDQKFEELLLFCRHNNKIIIACELEKIQAELNALPPGLIPEILADLDEDKFNFCYTSLRLQFETSRSSANVVFKFDHTAQQQCTYHMSRGNPMTIPGLLDPNPTIRRKKWRRFLNSRVASKEPGESFRKEKK